MQSNVFLTRFVGHNLLKLHKVDSTNSYLKILLTNTKPLAVGTVIMADEQFAGRGQNNNIWLSQAGKNLTFSTFLQPHFLAPQKQFKLNQAITLGITDCLTNLLGNGCKIKWPNDIYFNNDKIGGILIENMVRGHKINESVIGIGLNVNQTIFDDGLKNANSLTNISGNNFNLITLLGDILMALENRYFELEANINLDKQFIERLYRFNQLCHFNNGKGIFEAKITGVTDAGLLILEKNGSEEVYNCKEIEFVI